MGKFGALLAGLPLVVACLLSAGAAGADVKMNVVRYKCLVCNKRFYSFAGDALDSRELARDREQLRRVFQLKDRGKNLDPCRGGFKTHRFEKTGTESLSVKAIAENAAAFAAVKDGGVLSGISLTAWECMLCGKPFYSLGDENLNIREWARQPERVFNLKGKRPIQKCSARGYHGHVFKKKTAGAARSYDIAGHAEDIYWVKD